MSFNPYCDGSSSGRDQPYQILAQYYPVSILIVMEVAREGMCTPFEKIFETVSILIVMEVAREEAVDLIPAATQSSFNPYCDGSSSGSITLKYVDDRDASFNPYCDGSSSGRSSR